MAKIEIRNVSFGYSHEKQILNNINLNICEGEIISILGPSGCGKSTLLKLLLKELDIEQGSINIAGISIDKYNKLIGYMPQSDVLLDWYSVDKNVLLPLELNQRNTKIDLSEYYEMFKLPNVGAMYPRELSGGMKSRISLLRAYLMAEEVIILDEPLSKLDYITQQQILRWMNEMFRAMNKTIICVTHNIEEAITLSDRIILLSGHPSTITSEFIVKDYDKEVLKETIIKQLI